LGAGRKTLLMPLAVPLFLRSDDRIEAVAVGSMQLGIDVKRYQSR
jgi:hypothetical protein